MGTRSRPPSPRRASGLSPVTDPKCCKPGSRQITDGREILGRMVSLMNHTTHRWDLDFLLFANEILRWRSQAYRDLLVTTPTEELEQAKEQFKRWTATPVDSYNRDPEDPDGPSLPYDIGLVAPEKQFTELGNLLEFSQAGTRERLYCGCVASDQMMQSDFGVPSLSTMCAERFPPLARAKKGSVQAAATEWAPGICRTESAPVPNIHLRQAQR